MKPYQIHNFLQKLEKKGYITVTQWRNVLDEFELREQKTKKEILKKIKPLVSKVEYKEIVEAVKL